MKIFLSWSGSRSKAIAEVFREWLPGTLQAVRPYFSPDDLAKGTRWSLEVATELEASSIGLLFLTADNVEAPWIMFEAGALSKSIGAGKVCPMLFGINPSDLQGPLTQFQAAQFSRSDVERVLKMVNAELGSAALGPEVLKTVVDMWWPQLESRVTNVMQAATTATRPVRHSDEIIGEILDTVRLLAKREVSDSSASSWLEHDERLIQQLVEDWVRVVDVAADTSKEVWAALWRLRSAVYQLTQRHGTSAQMMYLGTAKNRLVKARLNLFGDDDYSD